MYTKGKAEINFFSLHQDTRGRLQTPSMNIKYIATRVIVLEGIREINKQYPIKLNKLQSNSHKITFTIHLH